jgi:hypothetical protein
VARGARHVTTPPPSSPPHTLNDNIEDDDAPAQFRPTSPPPHAGASTTAFYMRWKRAKASSGVALLKPGRKARATRKCRQPRGDTDERPARGDTRLYKIQSELECLETDADYLRANGMDLFHLGALGRLMRCVFSIHPSLSWKLTPLLQLVLYPWTQCGPRTSQSPSRPRRSRCCAQRR